MQSAVQFVLCRPGRRPRRYDLSDLARRLRTGTENLGRYDAIRRAFRFPTEATAARRGLTTLTRHECNTLQAELDSYVGRLDVLAATVEENADLLADFPGLSWSDLEKLGPEGRALLKGQWRRIAARRKLESFELLSSILSKDPPREWLIELANTAYADDERSRAEWISAVARMK